ncbi:MAG: hypothetical protein ACI4V1_10125 [Eubacteriales bacterium]
MKKNMSLLLSILVIASSLASCSDRGDPGEGTAGTPSNTDTGSNVPVEEEAPSRANTPDNLPDDLSFDGATINIYHFGMEDTVKYDCVGELSGDVVMDAVYNRNLSVEERLSVKLNWIAGDATWDGFPNQVALALQAGTSDYDMIVEESSRLFQQSIRGYFYDLMTLSDYIDLSQPWWYTEMMEQGSIDNTKRYFLNGDLFLTCMFGASAMYFNKPMFINYFGDVQSIYDHVLDGTWTYDVFADYCSTVHTDVNGDGKADPGDIFGFRYEQWGIPNYMSMSTGLTFCSRDENGYPVLEIMTEDGIQWGQTLYRLLYSDNISVEGSKQETFINQTSLFYPGQFSTAHQLRDVDFEYGILPYPKLSENLDYMSAAATVNGNGGAVPVSAPADKLDAVCAVMEALCAQSYRTVVPAWYDTALKVKYADGLVDAQMVDIIYEHISSSFIMMADKELGIGSIFTNAIYGSNNDGAFVSYYEGQRAQIEKKLEKCIQNYKDINQ